MKMTRSELIFYICAIVFVLIYIVVDAFRKDGDKK